MKFICYSDWDQLPDTANALFALTEKDSVFFSRPWIEHSAAELVDDDQSLMLACVVDGENVLAILPLMKNPGKTWYAIKHRYSPLFSLLLADDDQQAVLTCLAQGLSQLPIKGLLLEPVADDDAKLAAFQRAMEVAGFNCDHAFRHYNWIYRLQGQSFDDYMAARPGWLRSTIARKTRKLEREHDYEIRLFCGDEALQAMEDYYAIYSASWKSNEQEMGFVDNIVQGFSRAGWTRLAILTIDGQPAAAQLWFINHGKASIFRLAYDEKWKRYSPGSILTRFMMRQAIDIDKVEEIDFLTGNDAYKQEWMSERRERYVLACIKTVKPTDKLERFAATLKYTLKRTLTGRQV